MASNRELPISGTDIYAAERILKERTKDGINQYYIKWRGYPSCWNSWEPEENILNSEILPLWEEAKKKKKENEKETVKVSAKKRQRESTSKEYIPRKSRSRSKPLDTSAINDTTASSTLPEPELEPDDTASLTTTTEPNEPQARTIEVTFNGETVTFEQHTAEEFHQ